MVRQEAAGSSQRSRLDDWSDGFLNTIGTHVLPIARVFFAYNLCAGHWGLETLCQGEGVVDVGGEPGFLAVSA